MPRPLTLVASAALLLAPAAAARAADDPKDVVTKAIKAHGGEEYLTKHKAAQARSKGKITIPGVGEVEIAQETASMLPDKFKEAVEMQIAGQTIKVLTLVNGDKVTLEVNGKEMEVPDAARTALKDAVQMLKIARLVPLVKDKAFELSLIGDDKVEGKEVVGVRVSSKGAKDINLYFDKKTHLLAKTEYRGTDPTTGGEVNEERIVTEYQKNKDGIPMPKKLVVKHDGKTFIEVEVLEIAFLEKLDDSEFKK